MSLSTASLETPSSQADALVDRRRLRRRLTFWRVLAFGLAAIAVTAVTLRASGALTGGSRQIARIEINGIITDNKDQIALLRRLAKAKQVQGVLVHINSPGGTTTGGEALFEALRDLADKKPTVSVFGTMATSAAYIAGLATDHIVARGNTVTGSVGVIFQWADVSQLLDKLGVKMNEVKSGSLKAVPSMFAPLDEQGRRLTEEMVAESQRWFVGLVSSRRKIDPSGVPGLTQGRIFSGRQALESKLVDAIGGEREAVNWLETKRGVAKGLGIVDWKPKPENDWGLLGALGPVLGPAAGLAVGTQGREIIARLADNGGLTRLPLDGLVSVWHAGSN
jgi:protease IV